MALSHHIYSGNCGHTNPRNPTLYGASWSEYLSPSNACRHCIYVVEKSWCWIGNGSRYNPERYAGEYVWMWVALGVSVITYVPLALFAIGIRLGFNSGRWWRFKIHKIAQGDGVRESISMIAYVDFLLTLSASKLTFPLHQLPCRIFHTFHTYQHSPLGQWLREC
jgi:hypothetical protein